MKKIMFSDKYDLTKAVLEGRKTQTRRIMKGKPLFPADEIESAGILGDEVQIIANGGESLITMKLPFRVCEVVAVAQSYRDCGGINEEGVPMWEIISQKVGSTNAGWNNKMFVVSSLMPHQIRITDVRVERLQDISNEDCIKEGVELNTRQYEYDGTRYYCVRGLGYWRGFGCTNFHTPREAFAALIDKVSGKGTWERNPYVFVYDFELVK
ncbi:MULTISPECIES: hypothetical protein [Mediterranea]|uniref:hypothetical protein n=1 Tax=Mediterranea TaxID=1926659 RepID=UPI00201325D4|nr:MULTISPECIES: hypothetical protein [Mediterranea]MCL1606670.1 hypothetical protein [Mediterranea sp. ET5]MDM8122716.1 hypothetical protein [Mediterranea massiliensis]MDM8197172.1 hypothetical protein [Mediterranea massiliensis]